MSAMLSDKAPLCALASLCTRRWEVHRDICRSLRVCFPNDERHAASCPVSLAICAPSVVTARVSVRPLIRSSSEVL